MMLNMHETPRLLGGRYQLVERIGAGGMGEVWRATDQVLGRTVAVKLMLPSLLDDAGFERRFLFEARAMASLRHPGVVAIHDYRSDAEGAFLVMEFVEGEPLAWTLRRLGRLNPVDTMNLVAQAADALAAAHAQGIVHRDVKPGNLLIRTGGSLVLTDFGIARAAATTALTAQGEVLGTPSYLAPEQVLGRPATPVSDLYALGVVAYECLSGRRPFEADNPFGTAMKRLQEPPPPLPPDVPVEVARVVGAALIAAPEGRWRSAGDMAAAARLAVAAVSSDPQPSTVDGRTTVVRPSAAPGTTVNFTAQRRRRLLAVGAAAIVALVLVGAGIWAAASGTLTRITGGVIPGAGPATGPGTALPAAIADAFVPCGPWYCPRAPQCWGGLNSIGGRAQPMTARECGDVHRWETIAVALLPADAVDIRQDELLESRADIAAFCSAERQQGRSVDPDATDALDPEPWPANVGGTWVLYCLGGGPEHTGTLFRAGAS
jgi:eukaryotic-like serine/threonine-protein kinase